MNKQLAAALVAVIACTISVPAIGATTTPALDELGRAFCQIGAETPDDQLIDQIVDRGIEEFGDKLTTESKPIEFRGRAVGVEIFMQMPAEQSLSVRLITPAGVATVF